MNVLLFLLIIPFLGFCESPQSCAYSHKKRIIVISGPSGVGKTTIIQKMRATYPRLSFSLSATTRPPRDGEVDGKDYIFMDKATFDKHLANDDFLERIHAYNNWYGTLVSPIYQAFDKGKAIVFDMNQTGLEAIKRRFKNQKDVEIITIMIVPKALGLLARRHYNDSLAGLESRMHAVYEEIASFAKYDYVVINDNLEECFKVIRKIYEKHPLTKQNTPEAFRHDHAKSLMGNEGLCKSSQ